MTQTPFPLHASATVQGGQLVVTAPLPLADGANVRVVIWPAEAGAPSLTTAPRVELLVGERIAQRFLLEQAEHVAGLVSAVRSQVERTWGVRVPPVRLADDLRLEPEGWEVKVDQRVVAQGRVHADRWMALSADETPLPEVGLAGRDPTFGVDVRWVATDERERVPPPSFVLVEPLTVITTALQEALRQQLWCLYELGQLDAQLGEVSPALLRALQEVGVGPVRLLRLLRRLLVEGRSVGPLGVLVDAAVSAWQAAAGSDPSAADEACAAALLERFPRVDA